MGPELGGAGTRVTGTVRDGCAGAFTEEEEAAAVRAVMGVVASFVTLTLRSRTGQTTGSCLREAASEGREAEVGC